MGDLNTWQMALRRQARAGLMSSRVIRDRLENKGNRGGPDVPVLRIGRFMAQILLTFGAAQTGTT